MDILVKKIEEKEEYKLLAEIDRDLFDGLKHNYLLTIYNEANNSNLKRINLKNNIYFLLNRNKKDNDWTFNLCKYKQFRNNNTINNMEYSENAILSGKIIKLEYENNQLKEDKEKLKEKITELEKLIKNLNHCIGILSGNS